MEVAERTVLVAGAGITGCSVARVLGAAGARVTVTDDVADRLTVLADVPGVTLAVGLTEPPENTDLVVTSTGWRLDSQLFVAAAARGIETIGEVELAWRMAAELADPPTWLVVTGTNGKTTTVGMLEAILRTAGVDSIACGNIGLPVVEVLGAGYRVLAVELSSHQLHWSPSVRPAVGALLNLAEDHLDWHGDMAAYTAAKARALTGAIAVGGVDDDAVAGLLAQAPAGRKVGFTLAEPAPGQLGICDGVLVDRAFGVDEQLAEAAEIRPRGPAGWADALAAAALARAYGVPAQAVREGLATFRPAAHRAEVVAEVDGVRYIDDSKATNPHAALVSLRAHEHVVWLAGGQLKGTSVDALVAQTAYRLRGAVLIGADRDMFATALARYAPDTPVRIFDAGNDRDMTAAVRAASTMAQPGDVVLLAPAAASRDMFANYAQRGEMFRDAVLALSGPSRNRKSS
ncbi:UDP-N-acetylmuramoyl-L-alanine--D-glutamate ligase [Kibdelosporangium philippinense]|uniref:UDP-N-acetylmuramoylalanine--D-glutamate ligase n=1 Tax=Kibdelosporangium philippinense TaxID=211113 RepID=A0ABS8ZX65_9PSEU|nr:UDP-N-acetylmuramoyl-L-alanine--D-glutamate ligase [Kibdelosporangium philippinense]MCE7010482.1 UDP-N-acetylmuramoyl-L-alanine--D-glutamate ligase [Kibdelosporangium philippinense]